MVRQGAITPSKRLRCRVRHWAERAPVIEQETVMFKDLSTRERVTIILLALAVAAIYFPIAVQLGWVAK